MDKMQLMKHVPEDVYKLTSEEERLLKNYDEGEHRDVAVYRCKCGIITRPLTIDESPVKCQVCGGEAEYLSPGVIVWNTEEFEEYKRKQAKRHKVAA